MQSNRYGKRTANIKSIGSYASVSCFKSLGRQIEVIDRVIGCNYRNIIPGTASDESVSRIKEDNIIAISAQNMVCTFASCQEVIVGTTKDLIATGPATDCDGSDVLIGIQVIIALVTESTI